MKIDFVRAGDIDDLLPLMRAYSEFYEVPPDDARLRGVAHMLVERPEEGVQFIARGDEGEALGFATVYMTWETLDAGRLAVMNDLFVAPAARGRRVGEALIDACLKFTRERGAGKLAWQTAPDNATAQRLYDRVGAVREQWVDYHLRPDSG
ncbi:MAG TPA: GNAT family N-acetyltransferase [Solirubrobacterales bacterium]|nr:GNAT family N-acetyltransferase [Solirubrobacterales bacterium]